jgi:hypothetical protein
VTVPLIAHYGTGNPADPQKIILDPSRGGAVRLGEGEVQSGLRHHPDGTQVMINHSRRPFTPREVAEVARIRRTEQATGDDDASMNFSGAVETVHSGAEHQSKPHDFADLKRAAAARRGAPS